MSKGLKVMTDVWESKGNKSSSVSYFGKAMGMSVVAGLEMLTYMTNKTMHFVDMKPVFMQMIADNKVDADNIVGMTLLILNSSQQLRNSSAAYYVTELERILKEFKVEVETGLAEIRSARNLTVNRTIITENESFQRNVRQWFKDEPIKTVKATTNGIYLMIR